MRVCRQITHFSLLFIVVVVFAIKMCTNLCIFPTKCLCTSYVSNFYGTFTEAFNYLRLLPFTNELCHEKTNSMVFEQIRHKLSHCTIHVTKTKGLISFAVTAKLICTFVFAFAKCRFSHDIAQTYCEQLSPGKAAKYGIP